MQNALGRKNQNSSHQSIYNESKTQQSATKKQQEKNYKPKLGTKSTFNLAIKSKTKLDIKKKKICGFRSRANISLKSANTQTNLKLTKKNNKF